MKDEQNQTFERTAYRVGTVLNVEGDRIAKVNIERRATGEKICVSLGVGAHQFTSLEFSEAAELITALAAALQKCAENAACEALSLK